MNTIETGKYDLKFQFEEITNRRQPSDYWIMPQTPTQEQTPQNDLYISSSGFKLITPEEARKTKNTKIIGLSVAGVTILTGIGLFTLMRGGGNRKLLQGLKALKTYFEKKLETVKIDNRKFETLDKAYLVAIGVIESLTRKSEAINNYTTFKDLLFKKIMNLTKPTGKLHDSITHLFEQIGRRAVESSYTDTENKIIATQVVSKKTIRRIIHENPDQLVEINGRTETKAKWINIIKKLDEQLQNNYYQNFDLNTISKRYYRVSQIAQNLKSGLSKLRSFFSKDGYSKFIADEKIAKEKETIIKEVKNYRQSISYTRNEMIKNSEDALGKVAGAISFKDTTNRKLLRTIKQELKRYAKYPDERNASGQNILNAINKLTENIKNKNTEKYISEEDFQSAQAALLEIKHNISNYKQGAVEEILEIYEKLLSPDEYKKIKKVYETGIKSLDKSIKIETEDFTNKLRDLTMGSAPTDMLTIVGSLGVLGYQLGKSDNNDQRTSIALKYGIPAIAGVAVSLYCNAKLFAGSKALLIASISSWLLNRIGSFADQTLKKYKGVNVSDT